MKKYGAPLALFLLVIFQSYAMEVELKPCYLATMPCDILNYIASFLMETEDEFVERTRIQKEITPECKDLFDEHNLECMRWSFCPDETKLVAIVCDNPATLPINAIGYAHYLTIINLHGIKPEIMLQKTLSHANDIEDYDCIALSHRGNLLATFYENRECFEGEDFREFIFKIKRVDAIKNDEIKEKHINFSYDFYPEIIAFNKQGTHLIAHGKDSVPQKAVHQIFLLKKTGPNKSQKKDDSNTLQTYLRDKFVCNNFLITNKKRNFSCLQ